VKGVGNSLLAALRNGHRVCRVDTLYSAAGSGGTLLVAPAAVRTRLLFCQAAPWTGVCRESGNRLSVRVNGEGVQWYTSG
jgi:hypothetical protein